MTADSTADRLASIRARADAATAGPWGVSGPGNWITRASGLSNLFRTVDATSPDAEFIAAARTDVPFLLDQLAAAEAKIAQAPHAMHCEWHRWNTRPNQAAYPEPACTCWKSASPVSALDAVRAALKARTDLAENTIEQVRTACALGAQLGMFSDVATALADYDAAKESNHE